DTYWIDQLCLIALSAAYGAVCLALFFWNREMLTRVLGAQFHFFVLLSGSTLVLVAFLRGASLWREVGMAGAGHGHHHGPECATGDCHLGDDHQHEHAITGQVHHHHHVHSDHSHDDHDHGWAPW